MNRQRILIKIGGSTLGHEDTTIQDLVWLQREGYQPVVVHGGGQAITDWLQRMAVPTRFVRGLRVTDEAAIGVVVAVLAGLVNKRLVAAINAAGGRAVGLAGADGAALRARVQDPDLGLVGAVTAVDTGPLEALLLAGYLPVVSPIAVLERDGALTDTLLNVNADTAAAEIGAALRVNRFVFLTDVEGVRDGDGAVVPHLTPQRTREMVQTGVISGGMLPKVEACLRALEHVPSAQILDGRRPHSLRDCCSGQPIGTRIE